MTLILRLSLIAYAFFALHYVKLLLNKYSGGIVLHPVPAQIGFGYWEGYIIINLPGWGRRRKFAFQRENND